MTVYHFILNYFKKTGIAFLSLILILQIIGLLVLYSATHGAYIENVSLFRQQILWLSLGWMVFFIISNINYSLLSKLILPLYIFHIILLILIPFIGKEIFHAKRWIDLGLFNYQPSETLKFILVLLTAQQLSKRKLRTPLNLKDLLIYSTFIFIPILIILKQPDLGTAGIILLVIVVMILFNGVKKKIFLSLVIASLISLPIVWNFVLKPYQQSRITTLLQPRKDPRGSGYNIIQSKVAIGSGQFFGKGFGKGTQNRLQFLPERHTDFIFSVLSEEYGLFGSTLTLVLFFILISYMFKLASISRARLNCYFCIGAGSFFLWHVFLNVAMTMGLFPVMGAPLPLMSYGGSHTLTSMAFLGLIASVNRRKDFFYSSRSS